MALPSYNTSILTSIARVQQNNPVNQFVIGGRNAASYALFKKKSTSYVFSNWRSKMFTINQNFDVQTIKFAVNPAITTNISIIPVLYFDNQLTSATGTTINSTNYPNSEKLIVLRASNFGNAVSGKKNFFLELQFTGSALVAVKCPITIEVEIKET